MQRLESVTRAAYVMLWLLQQANKLTARCAVSCCAQLQGLCISDNIVRHSSRCAFSLLMESVAVLHRTNEWARALVQEAVPEYWSCSQTFHYLLIHCVHLGLHKADVSAQPLVVRGGEVVVADGGGAHGQPPQQHPVQLARHQGHAQHAVSRVVQGDRPHWIKGVAEACTVRNARLKHARNFERRIAKLRSLDKSCLPFILKFRDAGCFVKE